MNILVTGANQGLGLEIVKFFLSKDCTVIATYRHSKKNLSCIKNKKLLYYKLDVTNSNDINKIFHLLDRNNIFLDVIINNAAVYPSNSKNILEKTDIDSILNIFNINTLGPLRITQTFLPLLRMGKRKIIINISSEAASLALSKRKSEFGYCMSKAALNMQTKLLNNYLNKEQSIIVFSVNPGWMLASMGGDQAIISPRNTSKNIYELIIDPTLVNQNTLFIDTQKKELPW